MQVSRWSNRIRCWSCSARRTQLQKKWRVPWWFWGPWPSERLWQRLTLEWVCVCFVITVCVGVQSTESAPQWIEALMLCFLIFCLKTMGGRAMRLTGIKLMGWVLQIGAWLKWLAIFISDRDCRPTFSWNEGISRGWYCTGSGRIFHSVFTLLMGHIRQVVFFTHTEQKDGKGKGCRVLTWIWPPDLLHNPEDLPHSRSESAKQAAAGSALKRQSLFFFFFSKGVWCWKEPFHLYQDILCMVASTDSVLHQFFWRVEGSTLDPLSFLFTLFSEYSQRD